MKDSKIDKSSLLPQEVKYRDYQFILKVIVNVCLAAAYSGYCLAYFNTINFDQTMEILSIKADRAFMQGALSFCIPAGAALGGYLAKFLLDKYSRRECFIQAALLSIIVTLLLQTKALPLLFPCRFLQGLTVGISTVIRSTYIKQFAPLQLAGKFGVINQVFFAVGLISAFACAYLFSMLMEAEQYWRIIYLLPAVFLAVQMYNLVYTYPYETPKYLLEKGREEEARQLITIIYKPEYVEERLCELNKLIRIVKKDQKEQQMSVIGEFTPQPKAGPLTSNRIAVIAAYHLAALQQLSGIQVIIIYAGQIMLNINPGLQKVVPLALQIEGLVASLYAVNLISKYGRKQLIQGGLVTMGTAMLIISLAFLIESGKQASSLFWNILIILCLFICRGAFSLSIGPVVWLYLPEIVEPSTTGIATMLNWLAAAFVSFAYPVAVELTGSPSLVFFVFAIIVGSGYWFNRKLMVQTKGKAQWQIRKEYDMKLQSQ